MKQITINIKDHKYSFFLDLLKKMDFVSIVEEDWYESLSVEEKKSIQKGIEDLESGNIYTNDEVMAFSKKRISELKKTNKNQIEEIISVIKSEERRYQIEYDDDTFHSYVLSEQKKYEKNIDSLLSLHNTFKNPKVFINEK